MMDNFIVKFDFAAGISEDLISDSSGSGNLLELDSVKTPF